MKLLDPNTKYYIIIGLFCIIVPSSCVVLMGSEYLNDKSHYADLREPVYAGPAGCTEAVERKIIPQQCFMERYRLRSPFTPKDFCLSPVSKLSAGWFRVGDDALQVDCFRYGCTTFAHKTNVFGRFAASAKR